MALPAFAKADRLKSRFTRTLRVTLAVGLGLTSVILLGYSPPTLASHDPSDPPAENCVVTLRPGDSEHRQVTCFANFRAALAHATDGEITDAPLTAGEAVSDPEIRHELEIGATLDLVEHENQTTGAGSILSIEFEHRDHQGNSLTYRGVGGCDGDRQVEYSTHAVGAHWNDEISSYTGANGCQMRHWENENFWGARTEWLASDDYMGVMNDATSSLKWR